MSWKKTVLGSAFMLCSAMAFLGTICGLHAPVWGQETASRNVGGSTQSVPARADSSSALRQGPTGGGDAGEIIELDVVQIEGEIAQPNVTITVARQEPQFKQITLERTLAEGLGNLDISAQGEESLKAAKIHDWSDILERPRK